MSFTTALPTAMRAEMPIPLRTRVPSRVWKLGATAEPIDPRTVSKRQKRVIGRLPYTLVKGIQKKALRA